MTTPLDGLKVLDLSRYIAGPYCGMLLADMGADVIKVERPGRGEDTRAIEPKVGGESLYVMVFNRNKRSLTLDFRHPDGAALVRRLAAEADILIENFRPGTLEKMGCGPDALEKINPRLIVTRISGFGQDGPYAHRPCYDVIAQAMSGLMEMTGQADGPPTMAGTFIVDYVSALYAAIATLGAVTARTGTGRGQVVDVSLLDSAISVLVTAIPESLLLGNDLTRRGSRDRYSAPANNFQASDGGWLHISAGNDALFPRLARAMGRDALLQDDRFATHEARMDNVDAVEAAVADWVSRHETDAVIAAMDAASVPCSKVATLSEVVRNPQLQHRGQVVRLAHKTIGEFPMHGLTMKLSDTPCQIRRPAPSIGEHTDEVLADWLNLSAEEIAALRRTRVV